MTSRIFIIDTENLSKYGSIYNRGLTPADCVVFAYTENSKSVHLREMQPIIDSGCEMQLEEMETGKRARKKSCAFSANRKFSSALRKKRRRPP